jgi:hypothetical protein
MRASFVAVNSVICGFYIDSSVTQYFTKNGDRILQTFEQWARSSRHLGMTIHGFHRNPAGDLAIELSNLQKALKKYGVTHILQQLTPKRVQ